MKDGSEMWKLVCHFIRAIFKLMHEARLPGQGPHALGDKYGSVFRGALQTHRVMQDLASKGFEAHPRAQSHPKYSPERQRGVQVCDGSSVVRDGGHQTDRRKGGEDHALQKALSAKGAKN